MDMAPNPVPSMEINTEGKILWVSANPESQVGEILRGMEGTPADHVASSLECYEAVRTGSYCAIVAEFPLPGCSPDELLEEVWGYREMPLTRSVDISIVRLRRKIEVDPHKPRFIRTLHGEGYSLTPEG